MYLSVLNFFCKLAGKIMNIVRPATVRPANANINRVLKFGLLIHLGGTLSSKHGPNKVEKRIET